MAENTAPRRCPESLKDHLLVIGTYLADQGVTAGCATNYEALIELAEVFRMIGKHQPYTTQGLALEMVMEYELAMTGVKALGNRAGN